MTLLSFWNVQDCGDIVLILVYCVLIFNSYLIKRSLNGPAANRSAVLKSLMAGYSPQTLNNMV